MAANIEIYVLTENVNSETLTCVSEVGKRLRNARTVMGLSLRKFAKKFREDFSLIARIEAGDRCPPKQRLEKFAEVLSLTPQQLEALIAVERRGLDPNDMLPEIAPAAIPQESIEAEADKVLRRYCIVKNRSSIEGPVPVSDIIKTVCGLSTVFLDFSKEKINGPHGGILFGCLYPDGFRGQDKLVLVNNGPIRGRRLSLSEQITTIAHEAGHYVLHYGQKKSSQLFFRFSKEPSYCREEEIQPTQFNLKEDQASLFAACLLMPRRQFLDAWSEASGQKFELAKQFGVTEHFVRVRASTLGL